MTRTTLRRRAPLALAAGTALALVAAPAFAAVGVAVSGTTATITGDGTSPVQLSCTGGSGALVVGTASQSVACNALTALSINLGSGPETLSFLGTTAFTALPYVAIDSVDTAADNVNGSPVRDLVVADAQDVVSTGDGQDQIEGGRSVDGGAGNDRIIDPGAGPLVGGLGTDSVEYDYTDDPTTSMGFVLGTGTLTPIVNGVLQLPVTVSGVEQYVFSMPDGGDAINRSTIDGRGQDVRIVARTHSGIDTVYGGSGNDYVDAGPGTDVVDPGAGNDSVQGGEGDDTISVRDNEVDVVDCGDGTDTVTADRADVLKNCENVSLPPVPVVPTPAPETGGVVGLKRLPRGAKASFVFVSPTTGASFECRVDSKAWKTCRSPYKLRTNNLSVGKHKLYVRAVLSATNVDASPSKFGFTLQKPKPKKRR